MAHSNSTRHGAAQPASEHFDYLRLIRLPCSLVLAFALLPASAAVAGPDSAALRADELVERVLTENAGLAALRAAVQSAESRIEPAGALPDPRLRITTAPRTFDGFTTPAGQERGISGVIELSQELPWPGTLSLRADAARRDAAAIGDGVMAMRLRLAAETQKQYAQWAYVHRALEINEANQELVDELRRVAENRYAAGLVRQQDVLQAEVELQRLKKQALAFRQHQDAVRARLNGLLNRDANQTLAPPASLPEPGPVPSYAVLRGQALSRHPELAGLEQRIAADQAQESLAKKAFYPDLTLIARNNDYRPSSETRSELGLSINLPLDRSKRRAELDAARADTLRTRYELENTRARLLADLEAARTATVRGSQTIDLYQNALIPRTRENLSAARAEYGSGGGAFLDVITAEQQKLNAELELERARADYFAARAELERWTGGKLPTSGASHASASQVPHE
ncbi:MAG: transporter [Salinisphaeraceae bacterium]|jgi:outer membrane protein TolC|nr:transporter [Salinisphaeraceae bacterium]